jgi:hypothetical protein
MGESIVTLLSPNFSFMDAFMAIPFMEHAATKIFPEGELFYIAATCASTTSQPVVEFFTKTFSFSPSLWFGFLSPGKSPFTMETENAHSDSSDYIYMLPPEFFILPFSRTYAFNLANQWTLEITCHITGGNTVSLHGKCYNEKGDSAGNYQTTQVSGILIAIP